MADHFVSTIKEEWLHDVIQEAPEETATNQEQPSCDVTLQIFDEPYNPPSDSMDGSAAEGILKNPGVAEAIMTVSSESFDVSPFINHNLEVVSPQWEPYYFHVKPEHGVNSKFVEGDRTDVVDGTIDKYSTGYYVDSHYEHSPDGGSFEQQDSPYYGENRPYACNSCEYRCNNSYHLKRHLMTHGGEKPFVCGSCDYKSYRADKLKRHSRTHTGERPFVCLYCDYRANRADRLTEHLRSHSRNSTK